MPIADESVRQSKFPPISVLVQIFCTISSCMLESTAVFIPRRRNWSAHRSTDGFSRLHMATSDLTKSLNLLRTEFDSRLAGDLGPVLDGVKVSAIIVETEGSVELAKSIIRQLEQLRHRCNRCGISRLGNYVAVIEDHGANRRRWLILVGSVSRQGRWVPSCAPKRKRHVRSSYRNRA